MRLTSDKLEDLVAKQFGMKLVGWMFWNPETEKLAVAWKVEDDDCLAARTFFEAGFKFEGQSYKLKEEEGE